jgi:hypothetical protein
MESNPKSSFLPKFLLVFLVGMTLLTYYRREPTVDDAWFAEQSFWLAKTGVIRSNFFQGINGWEIQLLVSHKLFLAFGSLMVIVFGPNLLTFQFCGLVFFLILLAEIIFYIKSRRLPNTSFLILGTLLLIFSTTLLVSLSFKNRPEMMVAALGFGSFLLLSNDKINPTKTLSAGLLAGLATLAHLNGIIFVLGGIGMLLHSRSYNHLKLFLFSSGITCSLYFMDVLLVHNGWQTWVNQFINDPALSHAFDPKTKMLQMLSYPLIFFGRRFPVSLLLCYLLFVQRKHIKQLPNLITVYSFVTFLSFWLITKSNNDIYVVLFSPFIFCIIVELYTLRPFSNIVAKAIIGAVVFAGIYGSFKLIQRNQISEYIPISYKNLELHLPIDEKGVVPITFFFNEYPKFENLLASTNYQIQKELWQTVESYEAWALRNGAEFILLDHKYDTESYFPRLGTKRIGAFRLYCSDGRFSIYKK